MTSKNYLTIKNVLNGEKMCSEAIGKLITSGF